MWQLGVGMRGNLPGPVYFRRNDVTHFKKNVSKSNQNIKKNNNNHGKSRGILRTGCRTRGCTVTILVVRNDAKSCLDQPEYER